MANSRILPRNWDAKAAADSVLQNVVSVTAPEVRGAHDAEMTVVGNHAYIVAEVNDEDEGESASRPEIYSALSIVNLETLQVEQVIPFARGGQHFDNETLDRGACFVPRIVEMDARTLRCFFSLQLPGRQQAQTWYIDFDLSSRRFASRIHRAKLVTASGVYPMQPRYFHQDAASRGFAKPALDFGLYIFDSFKVFDGRTYVVINNFPGKQNALAAVNDELDTFEIVGHYNEPQGADLSESAVNRLPDGTWVAICRQDGGDGRYLFATSFDGREWSPATPRPFVPVGEPSKPTFDRFDDLYYLGWQDSQRVNGVRRSILNLDVSRDGVHWERKYRFESSRSFQYPTFRRNNGVTYLTATQGDPGVGGKTHIVFGELEKA